MDNICNFCNKEFSNRVNLLQHQKTVKSCLKLQGKQEDESSTECINCKKVFSIKYYKNHKIKCDLIVEKTKKDKDDLEEQNKKLKSINEQYELKLMNFRIYNDKLKSELEESNSYNEKIKMELVEYKTMISLLEKHNEKLHSISTSITMKLAEKTTTINNNNDYNYESESDTDDECKLPSTVYEKLNDAIDTIEDKEEKDNILTVSTFSLNNVTITSRHPDHYVNATQLCQAGNKKFNDWSRLDTTKDLITVLSADAGIPVSLLVESKKGGNNKFQQGSWIHPDLAIQLVQWISPSFALQVSRWIRGLFNSGSIVIDIALLKTQEKQLNIKDQRIKQLEDVCL